MGREARFLLALLGLLSGGLVGVVSMKLFVPRPPAGAGPDVHSSITANEVQDLVEPPDLSLPVPLAATASDLPPSRFSPAVLAGADPDALPEQDSFVTPAAFEQVPLDAADDLLPPPGEFVPHVAGDPPPLTSPPPPRLPEALTAKPIGLPALGGDLPAPPSFTPPPSAPEMAAGYVTKPGDSWWSLAEQTYGDGRLYRALFAWNRARDPRVSLVPGTQLELPPLHQLAVAWSSLLPPD